MTELVDIKEIKSEAKITREMLSLLESEEEAPQFYRGMNVRDAFLALFGQLELRAENDNVTSSLPDAISYAPTSQDQKGNKFLCVAGIDMFPGAEIKNSHLGRITQFQASGRAIARAIVIRFAGKEPGRPGGVIYMTPQEFMNWYDKNVEKIEMTD